MSYAFTFTDLNAVIKLGSTQEFTVGYSQAGEAAGLRRFKLIVAGTGIASADMALEGWDAGAPTPHWEVIPTTDLGDSLVGYWGPVGGFPMPGDYSGTSLFRVTSNKAGSYTITAELVDGANASLDPAKTGSKAVTVAELKGAGDYEVDPISRIEGHLGVKLTVDADGLVSDAEAHGNLWRGFENFLVGREPNDPITFTQRICGVCPVPHGQTATYAADTVYGYSQGFQTWVTAAEGGQWGGDTGQATPEPTPAGEGIPHKAVLVRNLVLSAEFLMSHITHLYHLAAPSYVQGPAIPPWTPYFDDSYYHPLLLSNDRAVPEDVEGFSNNLWSAVIKQYVKALRIRRLTFEAGALFAGRMPMTSCFVAGGVTNDYSADLTAKCTTYRDMMAEIGSFIVKEFVPLFLALGALYPDWDNTHNGGAGFGAGVGNFLSWGGFPQYDGTLAINRGYVLADGTSDTIGMADVLANLREHIAHSRYAGSTTFDASGNPVLDDAATITNPATEARTEPLRNDPDKYSWLKAPRWNVGTALAPDYKPMEVGPFARLVVNGLYPVNGGALASQPGLTGLYMLYTKTNGGVTGLDPAMIGPDLAVALVREGLAAVKVGATVYDKTAITGADYATLASVYGNANAVITGAVTDWVIGLKGGLSTMDRLRGRALEALVLITKMIGAPAKGANGLVDLTWPAVTDAVNGGWIQELKAKGAGATYILRAMPTGPRFGVGATEAPRGALMHMSTTDKGLITKYQCIVPTTWNASPKDANGVNGPLEKAMFGIPYSAAGAAYTPVGSTVTVPTGGGVEALRVAQSFDPCIACAVH